MNKHYITLRKQLWITDANSLEMIALIPAYREPLGPKLKPFRHRKDLKCNMNSADTSSKVTKTTTSTNSLSGLLPVRAGDTYQNRLSTATGNSSDNWSLDSEASS